MRAGVLAAALAGVLAWAGAARALTIVAAYDTSITNHPQAATIQATLQAAISEFESRITDPVTVNITFQRMYAGLGGSSKLLFRHTYREYLSALYARASSRDDAAAIGHLPDTQANPVNGNDSVWVVGPLARALGLSAAPQQGPSGAAPAVAVSVVEPWDAAPEQRARDRAALMRAVPVAPSATEAASDGTISLYLDIMNLTTNPTVAPLYSLRATAQHEIDEILGSASALNNVSNGGPPPAGPVAPEDLWRYDANGNRSFDTGYGTQAFFSFDGTTRLAQFNQYSGGDYSDWFSWPSGAAVPRVQDAFATPGRDPVMGVEWSMLDALGWNFAPAALWVDYNYPGGVENGSWANPYRSLVPATAAAAASGRIVIVKGPATGHELVTLSSAARIVATGGTVTVGR